ncbi:LytR/AlgR family response regulator transcription factor [Pedobacter hartonius]|uniref:Two component transcriptional regulator, LytTR family n=1 Tax=Pedobacter hartonius TaxID=425514 RepID=A0A1H4AY35_9SPHI|nr:LytTR family DNA-binding domain-containing protein [Pedobacter hartonius]SEA40744.1 two component transcriptional regulator, LytTR family [Pedobacter hartonius]
MKNILKCVIVDDEQHAIDLLTDYIAELPSLSLLKTFRNPFLALDGITPEDEIDIIFLDINMPGISGLELAKSLRNKSKKLVFTTAHAQYALDAFEVRADHYLLKPIRISKFVGLMAEIVDDLASAVKHTAAADKTSFFFIKGDEKSKFIRIDTNDIVLVEGLKNYIIIYTKQEKFTTYLTMTEVEKALEADGQFMRVHKSFIVKVEEIRKVLGNTILLKNERQIILGVSYKERFNAYLKENTLRTGRK